MELSSIDDRCACYVGLDGVGAQQHFDGRTYAFIIMHRVIRR